MKFTNISKTLKVLETEKAYLDDLVISKSQQIFNAIDSEDLTLQKTLEKEQMKLVDQKLAKAYEIMELGEHQTLRKLVRKKYTFTHSLDFIDILLAIRNTKKKSDKQKLITDFSNTDFLKMIKTNPGYTNMVLSFLYHFLKAAKSANVNLDFVNELALEISLLPTNYETKDITLSFLYFVKYDLELSRVQILQTEIYVIARDIVHTAKKWLAYCIETILTTNLDTLVSNEISRFTNKEPQFEAMSLTHDGLLFPTYTKVERGIA